MHVELAINYCSRVFALFPCVLPQKAVLLCKLFLVLFKETLFIWGWIFFLTFIVKISEHTQELKNNAALQRTHHATSVTINMVSELFYLLSHPRSTHILLNFAGVP